jgi:ketosteroid isomerase-like protein
MSQKNVDVVKTAYEAFGRGDIAAVVATFDPNIEWHSPAGFYRLGGDYKGPEEIVNKFFMVVGELWETLDITPREYIDAGDRVFVLGTGKGKSKATGKMVSTPYIHMLELKDGKVIRYDEFEDTATLNRILQPATSLVA